MNEPISADTHPIEAQKSKENKEAQQTLADLVTALKPLLPDIKEMFIVSGRHATYQVLLCGAGGAGVLALAFFAAYRNNWDLAEKLAIPVLSFFAGILAGKGKS